MQLRNYMNSFFDFILGNKEIIALLVSIVVGIATIVTSCVSITIMRRQITLAEEQNKMQRLQNQPIFDIVVYQQQDSDDGIYGTDILEVRNIGEKMTSCKITTNVFFAISYHNFNMRDTLYAEVKDYFVFTVHNGNDRGLVEKRWCPGNNRIYSKGYDALIKDSKDGAYYFYDKLVLIKVEYKDIHRDDHVVYFRSSNEIGESEYNCYFSSSEKVFGQEFFSLNSINYNHLKGILDKRIMQHRK